MNIADKIKVALEAGELMIFDIMSEHYPMTVRITHSELSGDTTLDFMVEGLASSPLSSANPASLEQVRSLCRKIIEEPTSRGFRIKLLL